MDDLHPMWRHLPLERQNRRMSLALRTRRVLARLQGRRERVVLVTTLSTQ